MEFKDILWYSVLISITVAYLISLWGVRAAKHHDVKHHSRWMITACTIVGLWLVGYVTKQVLFGRDQFGGSESQYWSMYVPLLAVHTSLAMGTIGLAIANLYIGLTRLRHGIGVGAMVAGVSRHRVLGKLMVGTFSGTLLTAYVVYLMLFFWFPS